MKISFLMNLFEEKYGVPNDLKAHLERRMFCAYQGDLKLAEPNLPYSHAEWFLRQGWMNLKNDEKFMKETVRGIINQKRDICFYVGYDFQITSEAEKIFFPHLNHLVKMLNLNINSQIFGGFIKQPVGEEWIPRKKYGSIKENLN